MENLLNLLNYKQQNFQNFLMSQGKDLRQELAESVVFPAHSTGTHRKHTGRWKQYSNRNFLRFFPYDFRPVPIRKHRQLAGIHQKNPKNFRSEYCFHFRGISGALPRDTVTFPHLSCRIPQDMVTGIFVLGY